MYFTEEQVRGVLLMLLEHFSTGSVLMETGGMHMLRYQNASVSSTSAAFQWGIDDVERIASWHDRLRYLYAMYLFMTAP